MAGILFHVADSTPPFEPTGTPYAWYDVDQIVDKSDGDPITTLEDLSASEFDLTGGSPLYKTGIQSGKPALHFTSDYLSYDFDDITQPNTMFMVFKLNSTANGYLQGGKNSNTTRNTFMIESGPQLKMYAGGILNGPAADLDSHVAVLRFNGASSFMRIDGVQYNGNVSTQLWGGISLGGDRWGAQRQPDWYLMEYIVYNGSEAFAENETGLATKWGISI